MEPVGPRSVHPNTPLALRLRDRWGILAPTGQKIHGEKVVPGHPQLAVDQGRTSPSALTPEISTTILSIWETKKLRPLRLGREAAVGTAVTTLRQASVEPGARGLRRR
jgi:hypothetical protein